MEQGEEDGVVERVLARTFSPWADYVTPMEFANELNYLSFLCGSVLEKEPRLIRMDGPVYVFGDIHGNLMDLAFFKEHVFPMGMDLSAGKFLFLGDYVDRGHDSLEVVAYLFAQKIRSPDKLILLRGNHELRGVNGWEEYYGDSCFLKQCKVRFGEKMGLQLWEQINKVFDRLPLACIVDNSVFCAHGGIPRPLPALENNEEDMEVSYKDPPPPPPPVSLDEDSVFFDVPSPPPGTPPSRNNDSMHEIVDALNVTVEEINAEPNNGDTRLRDIEALPCPCGIRPMFSNEDMRTNQLAFDLLWADPATEEEETKLTEQYVYPREGTQKDIERTNGFGFSPRGGGTINFCSKAVNEFLANYDLSCIIRAHEAKASGISLSKSGKVFTVFSTSKNHGCGAGASCGCILLENGKVHAINRSALLTKIRDENEPLDASIIRQIMYAVKDQDLSPVQQASLLKRLQNGRNISTPASGPHVSRVSSFRLKRSRHHNSGSDSEEYLYEGSERGQGYGDEQEPEEDLVELDEVEEITDETVIGSAAGSSRNFFSYDDRRELNIVINLCGTIRNGRY
eukprot:TRINITY_DN163_c0_g2_i3.p1 TRINITY_DN163_c0_g2~~TRINITY_DN163_c0_g2_i3.p1  ORF type:complete len:567 (-),score=154.51 TRINITY_DN163_c0_g2_i3:151-1851(-)